MIKVIYWNLSGKGIEIPTDCFKENKGGPSGLDFEIVEEIIDIEKKRGLVFYHVEYAKNATKVGYNSIVSLKGADKSIDLIIDVSKSNE